MRERATELAHEATTLARLSTDPSADPTGLDGARSALSMYRAREAIEEIDEALARLDVGGYGRCQVCDRSIPFELLVVHPHMRLCAACVDPVTPSARQA
jgi:RNA polymerase-binding transcription factor DksA